MPPRKSGTGSNKRAIEQYDHKDKQWLNNPPVGLVTPETDTDKEKKKYAYEKHSGIGIHKPAVKAREYRKQKNRWFGWPSNI